MANSPNCSAAPSEVPHRQRCRTVRGAAPSEVPHRQRCRTSTVTFKPEAPSACSERVISERHGGSYPGQGIYPLINITNDIRSNRLILNHELSEHYSFVNHFESS